VRPTAREGIEGVRGGAGIGGMNGGPGVEVSAVERGGAHDVAPRRRRAGGIAQPRRPTLGLGPQRRRARARDEERRGGETFAGRRR
jgi:hypothetical protein